MFNHYHKKQARIQGGGDVRRNPEIFARECRGAVLFKKIGLY